MDWTAVIDRHRDALRRVLAVLVGMAGLRHPPLSCRTSPPQGGRSADFTLPRHLHRAILRLLRPAEAAIRNWQAGTTGRFRRFSALRPGRPPGHPPARQRGAPHEVHDLLADMQYFAREALEPPDTS